MCLVQRAAAPGATSKPNLVRGFFVNACQQRPEAVIEYLFALHHGAPTTTVRAWATTDGAIPTSKQFSR
jgi:hypothetical protein